MEKAKSLFVDLQKASQKLSIALHLPPTEINRDATIQRFEFTFELFWKLLQTILAKNGIEAYGPKNAIREAGKLGILDNVEEWLEFLTARNLASHTYNEKLAKDVYKEAKLFLESLGKVLDKIEKFLII